MSIFDETIDTLLARCKQYQDIPTKKIIAAANVVVKKQDSAASPALRHLEKIWYESLAKRKPRYSVYADPFYIAEAWGCWIIYSRKYLRTMNAPNSLNSKRGIIQTLSDSKHVVDLGCGFGHTAAAWRELLPDARVIGTNLAGTLQFDVATQLGEQYGFTMQEAPPNESIDVAFASEYFEHFVSPLHHLREVVFAMNPRAMLIANAFGQRAIGHFTHYRVGSKWIHGKDMSRLFAKEMKRLGYVKVKTKLWNQRPTLWMRQ